MVDPAAMCRRHLLGEHVELHMLAGSLRRGRSIAGFLAKGLLEPAAMRRRHAALAAEIVKRGWNHASPLTVPPSVRLLRRYKVDTAVSAVELSRRCPECRIRLRAAVKSLVKPTAKAIWASVGRPGLVPRHSTAGDQPDALKGVPRSEKRPAVLN